MEHAPRPHRLLRYAICGIAISAVLLAGRAGWPTLERATLGTPPALIDRPSGIQPLYSHRAALGVAHNAGNRLDSLAAAARSGADVLEVDVVEVAGVLRAGHERPLPTIGEWTFRGPRLDEVWQHSAGIPTIKLDLKQGSPGYLDRVGAFISSRPTERKVMVSSRSWHVLAEMRHRAPNATRLLSIGTPQELNRSQSNPAALAAAHGVSVNHHLLDPKTLRQLSLNDRLVLAWTVNDAARAAHLLQAGVDGITTDNLAILRALREHPRASGTSARHERMTQDVQPSVSSTDWRSIAGSCLRAKVPCWPSAS